MPWYSKILPNILATFTGRRVPSIPGVDFEWKKDEWAYNLFRIFEVIFWRKYGIRREAAAMRDEAGRVSYQFFTAESFLSWLEGQIRSAFRMMPVKIWVPVLSPSIGLPMPGSPYLFAIAFDTAAKNTSFPFNYTVTGSNPLIMNSTSGNVSGTDSVTGITYNSVSLSKLAGAQIPSDRFCSLWYLVGPSTGSNSMAFTGTVNNCVTASYSGVKQSGFPDSNTNGAQTATGSSPRSQATTVVATNCWLFGMAGGAATGALTASTGTTQRGTAADVNLYDSNGTVSTGSQSLTWTWAGSQSYIVLTGSMAPPASGPTNVKTWDGVAQSTAIKTYFGLAVGSTKSVDGIT